MKRFPSWLTFTVLRLLVFAAPLTALLLIGFVWWLALSAATVIGLCLSYIFLSGPRNAVSHDIYAARHSGTPTASPDDEVEDAAADAARVQPEGTPGSESAQRP